VSTCQVDTGGDAEERDVEIEKLLEDIQRVYNTRHA